MYVCCLVEDLRQSALNILVNYKLLSVKYLDLSDKNFSLGLFFLALRFKANRNLSVFIKLVLLKQCAYQISDHCFHDRANSFLICISF